MGGGDGIGLEKKESTDGLLGKRDDMSFAGLEKDGNGFCCPGFGSGKLNLPASNGLN